MSLHLSRRFAGLALALAAACAAGTAAAGPLTTLNGEAPIVIAHRGASGYLPEHTLAGYELAVRMGVDYIEPDLSLTRDGQLVAVHDLTLQRTTNVQSMFAPRNGGYRVADFTLAELKTLDMRLVGTAQTSYPGFTPSAADAFKIPTFQEVITLAQRLSAESGREIGIYPEAKVAGDEIEAKILQALIANGYTSDSKVFIQSFHAAAVQGLRDKQAELGLDFQLVMLGSVNALRNLGLDNIAAFADGMGVSIGALNEAFISEAHALGMLVHGYTFGQASPDLALPQYTQYYDWGIDGVFSNYPDLALAARDAFMAEVPEPSSALLALLGLGGMAAIVRRRRSAGTPAMTGGAALAA